MDGSRLLLRNWPLDPISLAVNPCCNPHDSKIWGRLWRLSITLTVSIIPTFRQPFYDGVKLTRQRPFSYSPFRNSRQVRSPPTARSTATRLCQAACLGFEVDPGERLSVGAVDRRFARTVGPPPLDSNARLTDQGDGKRGTSAPNPNQHASRAKQPCSRWQQGSHGVLSLAISDIGERCETEGI